MDTKKLLNTIDTNREIQKRWKEYRQTTTITPEIRLIEQTRTLDILSPKRGETILEAGTGSCYLTIPLSKRLKSQGTLISSDVNQQSLQELKKKYNHLKKTNRDISKIIPQHYSEDYFNPNKFPESFNNKFDAIVSLATFHHFDCRAPKFNSGEIGRTNALKEFYRMLKNNGRLILSDVANNTRTQEYFDAIDNPKHFHPIGHPHDFFDKHIFNAHLQNIGFEIDYLQIEKTPWVFNSLDEASIYLNRLHNAKCSPEESLNVAKDTIGFEKINNQYHLKWELMILKATKKS